MTEREISTGCILLLCLLGTSSTRFLNLGGFRDFFKKDKVPELEAGLPQYAYGSYSSQNVNANSEYYSYKSGGSPYPDGFNSPGYGSSGYGSPGYGSPGYGSSGYGSSGYGSPGYGSAGYGSPGYASPMYVGSGYGSAGYDTPGYGSSGYGGSPGFGGLAYNSPGNVRFPDDGMQPYNPIGGLGGINGPQFNRYPGGLGATNYGNGYLNRYGSYDSQEFDWQRQHRMLEHGSEVAALGSTFGGFGAF